MSVPLVRQAALTTTKVPWFNGSTSWEQYQQVFDAIVLSNGWGDATAALLIVASTGRCPERGIIDTDAPPSFQEGIDGRPVLSLLDRRVDWQTTAENSIRQYGNRGGGPFQLCYYFGDVGC